MLKDNLKRLKKAQAAYNPQKNWIKYRDEKHPYACLNAKDDDGWSGHHVRKKCCKKKSHKRC